MMRLYAKGAGIQSAIAESTGRDFDVCQAVFTMLKLAQPTWDDSTIYAFIMRQELRCEDFDDRELIASELHKHYINLSEAQVNHFIENVRTKFTFSDPFFSCVSLSRA
jgi:hypothetical protein